RRLFEALIRTHQGHPYDSVLRIKFRSLLQLGAGLHQLTLFKSNKAIAKERINLGGIGGKQQEKKNGNQMSADLQKL
ncbi:MAG TPA: hypothetical protein VF023_11540, partial [Bryobacteraceae bacterium]